MSTTVKAWNENETGLSTGAEMKEENVAASMPQMEEVGKNTTDDNDLETATTGVKRKDQNVAGTDVGMREVENNTVAVGLKTNNKSTDSLDEKSNQQQQEQEKSVVNLNMKILPLKDDEEYSISDTLVSVLHDVKIPVSVSFFNVTYASWGKKAAITPKFLKENKDKFLLTVIGSDLKMVLKENEQIAEVGNVFECQLKQLIWKDINKVKLLRCIFREGKIKEVLYQNFKKYSSNKNKMNLSFIVRNSHALKIVSRDDQTYIRLLDDDEDNIDMDEDEIWRIISEGFDCFLVTCLKSLLRKFSVPIDQGVLQSCFNFGSAVLDKGFLRANHSVFDGSGTSGIMLKDSSMVEAELGDKKFVKCQNRSNLIQTNYDEIVEKVKAAINRETSVILLGEISTKPIILEVSTLDENKILNVLQNLRDAIDEEICKKKQTNVRC